MTFNVIEKVAIYGKLKFFEHGISFTTAARVYAFVGPSPARAYHVQNSQPAAIQALTYWLHSLTCQYHSLHLLY